MVTLPQVQEDQPAHVPPVPICNSLEEADSEAQGMVALTQVQESGHGRS